MNFKFKLIFRDYFFYFIITSIFILILGSLYTFYTYSIQKEERQKIVKFEALHLSKELEDFLDHVTDLMKSIGSQIISKDNTEKIAFTIEELEKAIPGVKLDWIPVNHYPRTPGIHNELQNDLIVPIQYCIHKCQQHPGKLFLSRPTTYNRRGLWEIQGVMGITDDKGKYLGILLLGLNIGNLNNKLQELCGVRHVSFTVLDEEFHIILQSFENGLDPKSPHYKNLLKSNYNFYEAGNLDPILIYKNIHYGYYKKLKNYPYIIITGFEENYVYQELRSLVIPRFIEFTLMGIFCLCLLYLFQRRVWLMAQVSQKAKEAFIKKIKTEMSIPMNTIIGYSDILRKYMRGEIDIGIDRNRCITLIDEIYETACNFREFSATNSLNFTYINVNTLIEECTLIHIQAIFTKSVILKTCFSPDLPPLYADELRFKQIILGLISLSLSCMYEKGAIHITTCLKEHQAKQQLYIIIEDNGLSFDREDIYRLEDKLKFCGGVSNTDESNMIEYSTIEKLVNLHNGTLCISKKRKGKVTTLIFNCHSNSNIDAQKLPNHL